MPNRRLITTKAARCFLPIAAALAAIGFLLSCIDPQRTGPATTITAPAPTQIIETTTAALVIAMTCCVVLGLIAYLILKRINGAK